MRRQQSSRGESGFGLVEIMVGLVIGLITILVITQVLMSFEGQKRTTSGAGDAQTNGALALFSIEHEVRMAGYGFVGPNNLYCPMGINIAYNDTVISDGAALEPVRIVDGGSGPDMIVMVRGSGGQGTVPTRLKVDPGAPTSPTKRWVDSPAGLVFRPDPKTPDTFLIGATSGTEPCVLRQLSKAPTPVVSSKPDAANLIEFQYVTNTPYNKKPISGFAKQPSKNYGEDPDHMVINLGNIASRRYQILCDRLVESDATVSVAAPTACNDASVQVLASQIVDLQARYGIDTNADQVVDDWVDATGTYSTLDVGKISRIKAIRVALVARSALPERDEVSPASITLWDSGPAYAVPDRHYRYRVFETIMPIRNLIQANLKS